GDEFVVVLEKISAPEQATLMCDKLLAALAVPARIEDQAVPIKASIGCALYPEHGTTVPALLRHADEEMYRQKHGERIPQDAFARDFIAKYAGQE
ncbi:MAG TPA: diguanylate cyclase, partial [Burkholderiaceae bacterium]